MTGESKLLDLMTRFVALSLIYKKDLMTRWPDVVTDEWLDVLNALEEELDPMEGNGEADSFDA